ncbi:E3 ubiquitin-protein ligase TRIM71-like [Dendronephthya gigantea]|uniref:E3 ubiquitin-protein ligase TRIM71-like n=1 Tax=Dendronephthya gigantea TaxID=151771 RepID=UPI00106A48A2|nr:E3 ubiquitin-protein ligase TRIM71-like [Dendronephthya gigantea]
MGGDGNLEDSVSLRCSFCNETFTDPYILNCLHSFCFGCIERQKQVQESILCKKCEQETSANAMKQNDFFANCLAKSLLKELKNPGPKCGNCSAGNNRLLKYCKECREYLCDACVYCHENTKLTREHSLISFAKFEEDLICRSEKRTVFCPQHKENLVESYCRSCDEAICPGCDVHQGHNAVSVTVASSIEVPNLKAVLDRAISKVINHEKCASRCCTLVDELRDRKSEICDQIRNYFVEYKEKVEEYEVKLQQEVLTWYDKQFKLIKQAQLKEEKRIEKITDAVRFSQVLLHHGTDAEILSLKSLVQSQLNRVASEKTGTTFIAAVEAVIRHASWEIRAEHFTQGKETNGLTLPEIHDDDSDDDEDDNNDGRPSTVGSRVQEENERNAMKNSLSEKDFLCKRRGNSGVEGKDFQLGSVISRESTKIWNGGRQSARDYRYDKILRNRSIGRRGSGCGEFHHPCDIAVDHQNHDDRLIVTDFNNNRVQVFSYYGEFLFQFGSRGCDAGQFNGPTGVTILHDSTIVVSDCLNNRIQLFTSDGVFIRMFGSEGRGQGQFWRPMGIAVDSRDRIIVVDQGNNRVQVFNSAGKFLLSFGKLGKWDGEISCPNFVAVDKEDNFYISDEINMRIQVFRSDGSYLRKISAQEIHGFQGNLEHLSGVAVDPRGYVVVGVKSSCSVRVFTPDGRFLRAFSSARSCPSRHLFASGIALTSAGEIVVSDWFNNRIRFL